jgi:hypothetical protein
MIGNKIMTEAKMLKFKTAAIKDKNEEEARKVLKQKAEIKLL